MRKIIAWAYMTELDDALTKEQLVHLMAQYEKSTRVIPFTNEVLYSGKGLLEANSIAHGLIDNEYYELLDDVKRALAVVCNDWKNERSDFIYPIDEDHSVMMFCDAETVISDDEEDE